MTTEINNEVQIRIVNPKKAGIFQVGDFWDSINHKKIELKYSSGEARVYKINGNATSSITLNLNNDDDNLLYEHIKEHPLFVKRVNPLLEITNISEKRDEKLTHEEISLEAKLIIKNLQGSKLANFARIMGVSTKDVSEKTLKLAMFEMSDANPVRVLEEWEDKNRNIKELLKKGQEKGVFIVTKSGVWKWKDHEMGINFEQAVMYLKSKENADLLPMIRKEVDKV